SRNLRRILLFMIIGTLLLLQALFYVHTYIMIYVSMIGFYFFQSPLFAQSNSLILSYIEGTDRKFGAFRIWGSFGWAVTAAAAGIV
ncbi:MFS transporter, partial [Paenibacillus sp. EKM208P]